MKKPKPIPQAVICNPPEPTVIEASDLASGMVAVFESQSTITWLVPASEASIDDYGFALICHYRGVSFRDFSDAYDVVENVRLVAGKGRP